MNANELAEKLENDICPSNEKSLRLIMQAATMLRQQQAEIDSLEGEIFVKDAIRKSYKEAL